MISFIVIGRNEGWKLSLCLDSIYKTIEFNKIPDFEVIYVDSRSTDDSIERAKAFKDIVIYAITGEFNAAIARNIGAKESKGNILFFIDGDVQLMPDFLGHVISEDHTTLKYDCAAGYIDHIFYDASWNFIGRVSTGSNGISAIQETRQSVNGGIFLIRKENWIKVGGMKTKFKKNQDLDLVLRLSRKKVVFIRVPFLMGLHHTIDYRNENRMWKILFSDYLLYPAVTARDHFFNAAKAKHTLRQKYTALLLLLSLISLVLGFTAFLIMIAFYLLLVLTKTWMNTLKAATRLNSRLMYYFMRIGYQMMSDGLFLFGFFTFFPGEKELKYKKIWG